MRASGLFNVSAAASLVAPTTTKHPKHTSDN